MIIEAQRKDFKLNVIKRTFAMSFASNDTSKMTNYQKMSFFWKKANFKAMVAG
jgi:hypothetical protein